MSSQFDPEIVDFYDSYRTAEYVYLASISVIVYDYLVTFERELDLFWSRKITGASALFFTARYTTLLYVLLSGVNFSISRMISDERFVFMLLWTPQWVTNSNPFSSCDMLLKAYVVVQTCQYIPWAAFASMRAYALSKNRVLFLAILLLSLAPFAVNFTNFALGMSTGRDPVFENCLSIDSTTPMELILFPILARSGLIIADLGLVFVTWRSVAFGPLRTLFGRQSFTSIMLWNGIIYAIVLLVLNVLVLSFSLASVFGSEGVSYLVDFSEPLTSILISRFLLELQQANRQNVKLGSDHPLHLSMNDGSLNFARVMGSIGATIIPEDSSAAVRADSSSLGVTSEIESVLW